MDQLIKERREQLATKVIKARLDQEIAPEDLAKQADVEVRKIHLLESQEYGDLKYVEVEAICKTLNLRGVR